MATHPIEPEHEIQWFRRLTFARVFAQKIDTPSGYSSAYELQLVEVLEPDLACGRVGQANWPKKTVAGDAYRKLIARSAT